MAELQTKSSGASVEAFLASLDAGARADANTIVALFTELSGEPATMWGASIVGFGRVHMVYESGRELDWFLVGFSPRKANLSLYITPGFATYEPLLAKLGKHTTGKSCLYVKRLADLDLAVLRELVAAAIAAMRAKYPAAGGEKATAKKATAKKPTAKKPTAKKPTAKKATAKKPTAKKPARTRA